MSASGQRSDHRRSGNACRSGDRPASCNRVIRLELAAVACATLPSYTTTTPAFLARSHAITLLVVGYLRDQGGHPRRARLPRPQRLIHQRPRPGVDSEAWPIMVNVVAVKSLLGRPTRQVGAGDLLLPPPASSTKTIINTLDCPGDNGGHNGRHNTMPNTPAPLPCASAQRPSPR